MNVLTPMLTLDAKCADTTVYRTVLAVLTAILSLLIVFMYAQHYIRLDVYPFDVDGWGHLSEKIAGDQANCGFTLADTYNPFRGFLLPAIFGYAYCIGESREAIQVLNALFHGLSCFLVVFFFARRLGSVLIPVATVLIWSIWPAYDFIHGYYFPEQIGALLIVAATIMLLKLTDNHASTARYPLLFGFCLCLVCLLMVRSSALLLVMGFSAYFFFHRFRHKQQILVFTVVMLLLGSVQPIVNYRYLEAFVPFTTQGGFALHEGTFIEGDDAPAGFLRTLESFREREAQVEGMTAYEENRYWMALAKQNISEDPLGQVILLVKKSLRFWLNIPAGQWRPTNSSLVIGLPLFILWLLSLSQIRRREIQLATLAVCGIWFMHALIHSEYRYSYVVFPFILISVFFYFKQGLIKVMKIQASKVKG